MLPVKLISNQTKGPHSLFNTHALSSKWIHSISIQITAVRIEEWSDYAAVTIRFYLSMVLAGQGLDSAVP